MHLRIAAVQNNLFKATLLAYIVRNKTKYLFAFDYLASYRDLNKTKYIVVSATGTK